MAGPHRSQAGSPSAGAAELSHPVHSMAVRLSHIQAGTITAGAAVSVYNNKCVCCAQNHTTFVPNVAVRFDFALTGTSTTGAAVSPAVSLYYTDRTSDNTILTGVKTTTLNLAVAQGVSPNTHRISHFCAPPPPPRLTSPAATTSISGSTHHHMSTVGGSFRPGKTLIIALGGYPRVS